MRAFTIRSSDIDRCPQHVLVPRHYRDDGTCRCDEGTPCSACGTPAVECQWIFQQSEPDARRWCCDACRISGPTRLHRLSQETP